MAYKAFRSLADSDQRIKEVRMPSQEAAKLYPDGYFDYIYLDADHTREGITADIESWWPKLKPGGIFAGHDYIHPNHKKLRKKAVRFEVKPVVDQFVKDNNLVLHKTQEAFASWFLKKP